MERMELAQLAFVSKGNVDQWPMMMMICRGGDTNVFSTELGAEASAGRLHKHRRSLSLARTSTRRPARAFHCHLHRREFFCCYYYYFGDETRQDKKADKIWQNTKKHPTPTLHSASAALSIWPENLYLTSWTRFRHHTNGCLSLFACAASCDFIHPI